MPRSSRYTESRHQKQPPARVATSGPFAVIATPSSLRRHPVAEDVSGVALAQALERAIAQLSHTLASDAELARNLLQRHRAVAFEPEVQRQHATIPRREHLECA